MEVGLKLVHLVIGKTAELERVSANWSRVSSVETASQSSGKDHASRRDTSNLEAAGSTRSKGELSTVERCVAHVEVVLRNGVEGIGLAALLDAATTDGAADYVADKFSASAENTVASEAFAVKRLLGFDGGGEGHGEGNNDGGEMHLE